MLFYLLRPHVAATLTFFSATMFLPNGTEFDIPALPGLGKETLASLIALVCTLGFARPQVARAKPLRGLEILIVVVMVASVFSRLTNLDPVHYGVVSAPGVDLKSIPGVVLADMLVWGVPFFVGRVLFDRSEHLRDLLVIVVFAGLVYSLLIMVELRLSPQLHRWTYGFHQHGFYQTIRESGYRPMVYMTHGLHVALFSFMSMTASWTLFRTHFPLPLLPFVPKIAVASYLSLISTLR